MANNLSNTKVNNNLNEIRNMLVINGYTQRKKFKVYNLTIKELLETNLQELKIPNYELIHYFKILYILYKKGVAIPHEKFIKNNICFFEKSFEQHKLGCNFDFSDIKNVKSTDYCLINRKGNLNWNLKIFCYNSKLLNELMYTFLKKDYCWNVSKLFYKEFETAACKNITSLEDLDETTMLKICEYFKSKVKSNKLTKLVCYFFMEYAPNFNKFLTSGFAGSPTKINYILEGAIPIKISDPFKQIDYTKDKFIICDKHFNRNSTKTKQIGTVIDASDIDIKYKKVFLDYFLNEYYSELSVANIHEHILAVKEFLKNNYINNASDYFAKCDNQRKQIAISYFLKFLNKKEFMEEPITIPVLSKFKTNVKSITTSSNEVKNFIVNLQSSSSVFEKIIGYTLLLVYKTNMRTSQILNLKLTDVKPNAIYTSSKVKRKKRWIHINEDAAKCIKNIIDITREYRDKAPANIKKHLLIVYKELKNTNSIRTLKEHDLNKITKDKLTVNQIRKISIGNIELGKTINQQENINIASIDTSHEHTNHLTATTAYLKNYVQKNKRPEFIFGEMVGDLDFNGNIIINGEHFIENIEQIQPCFVCAYYHNETELLQKKIEKYKKQLEIATDQTAIKFLTKCLKRMEEKLIE